MLTAACRQSSMTSGEAVFLCDESIVPATEFQRSEFQKRYPEANITLKTGTPSALFRQWMGGESAALLMTRRLDSAEAELSDGVSSGYAVHKVALDGIAVIVNHKNPVTALAVDQLKKILAGDIKSWTALNQPDTSALTSPGILILREPDEAGNSLFLKTLGITYGDSATQKIFTEESGRPASAQIIEFTASQPGAIGMISTAWLSENPDYLSYYNLIRIVSLSADEYGDAVEPIPGYLYRGDYPLRRLIYLYTRNDAGPDVSLGFASFLCGNEGQKLFLECNLVPVVNPVRLKTE